MKIAIEPKLTINCSGMWCKPCKFESRESARCLLFHVKCGCKKGEQYRCKECLDAEERSKREKL